MFKKATAAILSIIIILTLAACGDPALTTMHGARNTPGLGDGRLSNNERGEQSYAGAYARSEHIINELNDKLESIITPYNEKREAEDKNYDILSDEYIGGFLAPFASAYRAFTAALNEKSADTENMAGIELALSFAGAQDVRFVKNAANDYTLTFTVKDDEGAATDTRMDCKWAPALDSMRYVAFKTENGVTEVSDYFEYTALSGGFYAMQSKNERAYVKLEEGSLAQFIYTVNKNDLESGGIDTDVRLYDVERDSIFGKAADINGEWAKGDREDIGEIYIFDGMGLTAQRCVAHYEGTYGEYTAREWVWNDAVTITPES